MRSAGSSLLPLLLGVAFALWSPLLSFANRSDRSCSAFPTYSGWCRFPKERFFYNITSKRCHRFMDYGCPMNVNSYPTRRKCQQFCSEIEYCKLPPEMGFCKAKLQRWFYDPKTKNCKKFIFGGCGGNLNNFKTRWTCQQACRKRGSPCGLRGWKLSQSWKRPGAQSPQVPFKGGILE